MPTRNVVLTDRQAEFIELLVATGRYQNASEVLREGIRLVERQVAEDSARLEALRNAAQVGIDDLEAGRFDSFDTPEGLRRHLGALAGKAIAGGADREQ
ncbi:MAG: type II toxin-antitoxin system ParD family antitoxin [Magnetospirillum sp.]|nr:type II toxin-antitoxin system ParD family antitoxin [Magnetospirillum sp.]